MTVENRSRSWIWPVLVTAGVAAGALLPQASLRDAATLEPASGVALEVTPAFVVFSPLCRLLDALMLLGTEEHLAVVTTVLVGAMAWRAARRRRGPWRRVAIRCGLVTTGAILGAYALAVSPAYPPLSLRVADPDVVVVDFHSHTNHSWDGRASFTVERNRAWHRAAGWHVAYVTDHTTLAGAALAVAANPPRAGADTVLLPAVETRRSHLVVLGMAPDDWAALLHGTARTMVPCNPQHVVIQTIPHPLTRIGRRGRCGPFFAIELSDGDPRGLAQERLERARVLEMAHNRNLAIVASSNNHGWTSTPVAWSLLRILGWRDLTPEALDRAIQDRLRSDGRGAVTIVERYGADLHPGTSRLVAAAPDVVWHVLATLTLEERLSWVAWAWAVWLVVASWPRSQDATR